jgi:hypothetical protein
MQPVVIRRIETGDFAFKVGPNRAEPALGGRPAEETTMINLETHLVGRFGEAARPVIADYVRTVTIAPNEIIRRSDGRRWFGLRDTQIDDAIAGGKIPRPMKLIDGGRAAGWLGIHVIEFQVGRLIAAARAAKAA